MPVNKLVCIMLLSLYACTTQPSGQKNNTEIVKKYRITKKMGLLIDTSLQAENYYNSNGKLNKAIDYYENRVLRTTVYMDKDSADAKNNFLRSDSIFYVIRSEHKESVYYNGKLNYERYFDARGNIIKQTDYNDSTGLADIIIDYIYSYNSMGKKNTEVYLWNKDTVSAARFIYKDSLLIEKYFLNNECCDRSQPIPADKIMYEYDKNGNLSKEMVIIDRTIRRAYKNKYNGYYNEVRITTYLYDSLNRLVETKVHIPNFSDDSTSLVSKLFEPPTTLQETFFYKYN